MGPPFLWTLIEAHHLGIYVLTLRGCVLDLVCEDRIVAPPGAQPRDGTLRLRTLIEVQGQDP